MATSHMTGLRFLKHLSPTSSKLSHLLKTPTTQFLAKAGFTDRSYRSRNCSLILDTVRNMSSSSHAPVHFRPVTHVIFDVDGLLIDSEKYYTIALSKVCQKYGKQFSWKLKSEMMGTTPKEGAAICLTRLGLADKLTPEDLIKEYEIIMKELSPTIRLMPGALRLLDHLEKNKIPIAIATGSAKHEFESKTAHLGEVLRRPFSHHVFAGSDPEVKHGKPFPDVFIQAGKRFADQAKSQQSILVFEDAINGVKAAVAAGMQVILVPDKQTDISNLEVKPTLIIESLEHFKPEIFGLPPFPSK